VKKLRGHRGPPIVALTTGSFSIDQPKDPGIENTGSIPDETLSPLNCFPV
jgi:hypothetical protein